MKRQIELPDVLVFVLLAATFAVGYFLPLALDARVAYAFGWLAAVVGFVIVESRFLPDRDGLTNDEILIVNQFRESEAKLGGPHRDVIFVAIPIAVDVIAEMGGFEAVRVRALIGATKAVSR